LKFDIYCDESRPDLLGSKSPPAQFMVIGSLWLATEHREEFKVAIHELRDRHKVGGEFKWQKVTPSRIAFYQDLIDWFFAQGDSLRFRCIAVEHQKVNLLKFHHSDQELGFYKFYYQMLHHWILDCNEYSVFCDFKSNRQPDRLHVLRRCLAASNLSSQVAAVQATRSTESVLIQLADVLTGAAAAKLNASLHPKGAKGNLVSHIESKIGHPIKHTAKAEQKFNVFVIDLHGGW
jgi:hypothetical protein